MVSIAIPLFVWAAACLVVFGVPLLALNFLHELLASNQAALSVVLDPAWAMLDVLGYHSATGRLSIHDTVLDAALYGSITACIAIFAILLLIHGLTPLKWQIQAMGSITRIQASTALHDDCAALAAMAGQPMPSLWLLNSPRINAWVYSAPGGRRAVLLTDGLVNQLRADQLRWVFAHELGHLAHGDAAGAGLWAAGTQCLKLLDRIRTLIVFWTLRSIARLPVLCLLHPPIALAMRVMVVLARMIERFLWAALVCVSRVWNRHAEFRADVYASELIGPEPGAELLQQLARTGSPLLADLIGSHPSHSRRIQALIKRHRRVDSRPPTH
ncbi:M48 family metalloprotease [Salinisphaera sp. T31B1]|uniref:M48 family metallopeptidase n=1 Tax=Salinisphaera sp. T31B1 TaxID=727963 RepID=UPI003340D3A6